MAQLFAALARLQHSRCSVDARGLLIRAGRATGLAPDEWRRASIVGTPRGRALVVAAGTGGRGARTLAMDGMDPNIAIVVASVVRLAARLTVEGMAPTSTRSAGPPASRPPGSYGHGPLGSPPCCRRAISSSPTAWPQAGRPTDRRSARAGSGEIEHAKARRGRRGPANRRALGSRYTDSAAPPNAGFRGAQASAHGPGGWQYGHRTTTPLRPQAQSYPTNASSTPLLPPPAGWRRGTPSANLSLRHRPTPNTGARRRICCESAVPMRSGVPWATRLASTSCASVALRSCTRCMLRSHFRMRDGA